MHEFPVVESKAIHPLYFVDELVEGDPLGRVDTEYAFQQIVEVGGNREDVAEIVIVLTEGGEGGLVGMGSEPGVPAAREVDEDDPKSPDIGEAGGVRVLFLVSSTLPSEALYKWDKGWSKSEPRAKA